MSEPSKDKLPNDIIKLSVNAIDNADQELRRVNLEVHSTRLVINRLRKLTLMLSRYGTTQK